MRQIFFDKDWDMSAIVDAMSLYSDVFNNEQEAEIMFKSEAELLEFVLLNIGIDSNNNSRTLYVFDMAVPSSFLAKIKQKSNTTYHLFDNEPYKFISDYAFRNYNHNNISNIRSYNYNNVCFILSDSIHFKNRKGYANGYKDNFPITYGIGGKNYKLLNGINKIHLTTLNK